MRTRIISAFPGTGKSYYHKKYPETTLDSDSSLFSWIEKDGKKIRNPEFPENYIKHIKENIGKYEFIFVSSHKEIRDALLENCLFFYLVYPSFNDKRSYIERYEERGSDKNFIKLISDNWYDWIYECLDYKIGCKQIEMVDTYLEPELNNLLKMENM